MGVYARGQKLWLRYKDVGGKWRDAFSGFLVGHESEAQRVHAELVAQVAARREPPIKRSGRPYAPRGPGVSPSTQKHRRRMSDPQKREYVRARDRERARRRESDPNWRLANNAASVIRYAQGQPRKYTQAQKERMKVTRAARMLRMREDPARFEEHKNKQRMRAATLRANKRSIANLDKILGITPDTPIHPSVARKIRAALK